jgi:DNA replication and repair protein RecF
VILTLSQIHLFKSRTQNPGILLIDDLPSELDRKHQNLFIDALHQLQQQLFITAIEPDSLDLQNWTDSRVFHVKHGQFTEVV